MDYCRRPVDRIFWDIHAHGQREWTIIGGQPIAFFISARVFMLQVVGERANLTVLQVRTAIANDIAVDCIGIHQLRFFRHGQ